MYNPYTPKTKKENIVSLTEQEHREYHSVHTTTPQWQESLKLSTVICSEFQGNTPMAIYPVGFMESFIETQIAQARREGFDDGWIACKVAYENGIKSALSISSL